MIRKLKNEKLTTHSKWERCCSRTMLTTVVYWVSDRKQSIKNVLISRGLGTEIKPSIKNMVLGTRSPEWFVGLIASLDWSLF